MLPSEYGRYHQGMLRVDRSGPHNGNNRSGGRSSTVDGNLGPITDRRRKKRKIYPDPNLNSMHFPP